MVVSQAQLNKALEEINSSYSKLLQRLEDLEEWRNEQGERPKTSSGGRKRVQQAKADTESSD
jgi:hypothetical protein